MRTLQKAVATAVAVLACGHGCLQQQPAGALTSSALESLPGDLTTGLAGAQNVVGQPEGPKLSLVPTYVAETNTQLFGAFAMADDYPEVIERSDGSLFAAQLNSEGSDRFINAYGGNAAADSWSSVGRIALPAGATINSWTPVEIPYQSKTAGPRRMLIAVSLIDSALQTEAIQIYASDDAGSSWGQIAKMPIVYGASLGDVSFLVDDEGNTQMYWLQRDPTTTTVPNQQYIYRSVSNNNGLSWSTPNVAVGSGLSPRFPSVAHVPSFGAHSLVLVTEDFPSYITPIHYSVYMTTSFDNGASWADSTLLLQNSDPNIFYGVPRASNRGDGTLIVAVGTNETAPTLDTSLTGRALKVFAFNKIPASQADAVAKFDVLAPVNYRYSMASTYLGNLLFGYADSASTGSIGLLQLR